MRSGLELLEESLGSGPLVERHQYYDVRLRIWLNRGDLVHWPRPWGLYDRGRLEDDGTTLFTALRVDRVHMFAGLFYGVEGMRVGGQRRIQVAPHLAYRDKGLAGVIPPNALLAVEIEILRERALSSDMNALKNLGHDYKREYARLVEAVSRAIDRADPISLLSWGAPADEYSPEVDTIVPKLTGATSAEDVQRILHEEFLRWFDADTAGPLEAYQAVANEVWQAVVEYRRSAR